MVDREDIPQELLQEARNLDEHMTEKEQRNNMMRMIHICEQHDIENKVEVIGEAMRIHLYQTIDQSVEELKQQLRMFQGL